MFGVGSEYQSCGTSFLHLLVFSLRGLNTFTSLGSNHTNPTKYLYYYKFLCGDPSLDSTITLYTTYMIVHVGETYVQILWWLLYDLSLWERVGKHLVVHFKGISLQEVTVYHDRVVNVDETRRTRLVESLT